MVAEYFTRRAIAAGLGTILLVGAGLAAQVPPQVPAPATPARVTQDARYVIGAGDILQISIFNQADLTGRFAVAEDGSFTFPHIGRVQAAGLTAREIETALVSKLAPAYLINPQVTVSVDSFKSKQFFVLGAGVNVPGSFYLTGQETLIQAIAKAQGAKADADDEVLIVRSKQARNTPLRPDQVAPDEVRRVSLSKLASGDMTDNIAIQDGDTIIVNPAENVFISGFVRNPGPYPFKKGMTILQLISMAGGLHERGTDKRLKVIRMVNGKRQEIKVTLDDTVNPKDTVVVPEKWW